MWQFLAAAYRRIRRAADGRKVRATAVSAGLGSDTLSELSDPEVAIIHHNHAIAIAIAIANVLLCGPDRGGSRAGAERARAGGGQQVPQTVSVLAP